MSTYGDPTVYAKYLQQQLTEECGCSGTSSSTTNCECCPPGLVAVPGADGASIGCLTPADAEEFISATRTCNEGYAALYKEDTTPPAFRGCVSESEFAALYAALNP